MSTSTRRMTHQLFQGGERVQRRMGDNAIVGTRSRILRPSEMPKRVGTVTGPATERYGTRGAWYVPIQWDGQPVGREDWVHINRLVLLED